MSSDHEKKIKELNKLIRDQNTMIRKLKAPLKSYDDQVKLDQCCDWGRFAVYKNATKECPTNTIEPLDKTVDNMECIGTVLCCLH